MLSNIKYRVVLPNFKAGESIPRIMRSMIKVVKTQGSNELNTNPSSLITKIFDILDSPEAMLEVTQVTIPNNSILIV